MAARENPIRVCHVISGLGLGGAETMLYRLVQGLDRTVFDCRVVSMTSEGDFGPRLRTLGVPVDVLGMRRGSLQPAGLLALVRLLRRQRPDIVQTWMYHADLMGGLAARFAARPPVVWGIRHTDLRPGSERRMTRLTAWLNARLSRRLPARIVCNSEASRQIHTALGFDASRMRVIPNGFDTDVFRPDAEARLRVRRELGLPDDALVVGHIARFHPLKGHEAFIRAAGRVVTRIPRVRFLLAGDGVAADNASLAAWISESGIGAAVHLLGKQPAPASLYAAMDAYCLSSIGESFPQVVGEAMASSVPCVVTDVGDAAAIVGTTGQVVPPGDVLALANALEALLTLPADSRRLLGARARERIQSEFSLAKTVGRYADLYMELAGGQHGG